MLKLPKKAVSISILLFFTGIVMAPAAFAAVCPDEDEDGYITLNSEKAAIIFEESGFNPNGNYSAAEWKNYFEKYKTGIEGEAEECTNIQFKKGAEPVRCDANAVSQDSGVFDPTKVSSVSGSQVNPGTYDQSDNGIDEDCNGSDAKLLASAGAQDKDLGGLGNKVITYLSRAVVIVSVVFLIIGGIMYSTAAGDETKTGKAKKTMIGAVIGLIVGLLAPSIVNYIIAGLG